MFKFVNNSFKPSIPTSVSAGNVHCRLCIIISAVCRCQDQEAPAPWGAARLRGPAPAPVTLTLRGISSHENWDWGLGPGSQSPDIPGQGSGQSSPRLCDVRRSVKCKEFTRRKCEKWLNKQLWKVHCWEVKQIAESQNCDNSLIDEYRKVCFHFQVVKNQWKQKIATAATAVWYEG